MAWLSHAPVTQDHGTCYLPSTACSPARAPGARTRCPRGGFLLEAPGVCVGPSWLPEVPVARPIAPPCISKASRAPSDLCVCLLSRPLTPAARPCAPAGPLRVQDETPRPPHLQPRLPSAQSLALPRVTGVWVRTSLGDLSVCPRVTASSCYTQGGRVQCAGCALGLRLLIRGGVSRARPHSPSTSPGQNRPLGLTRRSPRWALAAALEAAARRGG